MGKQQTYKIGAGRKIEKKKSKKKSGIFGKLVLALVTCVNLVLSVLLHLLRRQEVLHAVQGSDEIKVLLETKPKTKENA